MIFYMQCDLMLKLDFFSFHLGDIYEVSTLRLIILLFSLVKLCVNISAIRTSTPTYNNVCFYQLSYAHGNLFLLRI